MNGVVSIGIESIDLEQPPLIDHNREPEEGEEVCNRNGSNNVEISSHSNLEPCNGMEFESKEDAFSFYKEYANSVGFTPIIKASRRSRISGKFIDAKFVCTRYGTWKPEVSSDQALVKKKRGRSNQSLSKTDCKAFMHVKIRQEEQTWEIHSFLNHHNHELFPGRYPDLNLSVTKSVVPHNQRIPQRLILDKEDLSTMLEHFTFMQEENPNFFYALDFNEDQHLRNVMWVDAKARVDYEYFNDVVLFDNSYIKNAYKLPLVLFIGVNHHSQFLLLGCALIFQETKLAYKWAMQAWLRAVNCRSPKVLLTDFDQCSKEAVDEIFLDSRHCFSISHILNLVPEKLGYVIRQHEDFMVKFNECVFRSSTEKDFEKRWWELVDTLGLSNDEWIQSLYNDRRRWIPSYTTDTFFSGMMSTTQQQQRFDIIQRKTTLKDFLGQYKSIFLTDKLEEESKADFKTCHKQPGLISPSPFGKQMATIYTHSIFKKFQVEVLGVVACHPKKESQDGSSSRFNVQDFEVNRDFLVVWNETTSDVSCSCRFFQYNGFLCRHVMIVLQISGVHTIPSRYILRRWTKDAKNSGRSSNEQESRIGRYNYLVRQAFRLGDEGSSSEESYNIAIAALEEALRKCKSDSDQPETDMSWQHSVWPDNLIMKMFIDTFFVLVERCCLYTWQVQMTDTRALNDDGYFVGQQHFNQNLGQFNDDYHTNQQSMSGLVMHNINS